MIHTMSGALSGILTILVSMLLSVAGLLLVRRSLTTDWLKRHGDMAGYYFHIIGTLYAVLIAFAIYMVWSAYKTSGANLEHEATEVADLSRLSTAMPDAQRREINAALLEYLNAVSQDEFPAMAQGRTSQRTWTAMQRVWEVYGNAQVDTPKVQGYFNESLKHLTQLSDLRRTRLFASHGTVPAILWGLLSVVGVLLVGFTYFVGYESLSTHAVMTACLAGVLSFCMVLLLSLNDPYSGFDSITPEPFQLELQHVASRMLR